MTCLCHFLSGVLSLCLVLTPNPSDPSILHMGALYALIGLSSGSWVSGTTPLMDSLGLHNLARVSSCITFSQ